MVRDSFFSIRKVDADGNSVATDDSRVLVVNSKHQLTQVITHNKVLCEV